MRRLGKLSAALLTAALLAPVASAEDEISVTAAGAGTFPQGALLLGLPLQSLSLGIGLGLTTNWALGQFQVTLTGTMPVTGERSIVVDGRANAGAPSAPGTAAFSGTATVDPGNGTPLLVGVPFAALLVPNPDGTGALTISIAGTNLPAATINEGNVTVR